MYFKNETEQQVFDIAYSRLDEMEKQFIGALHADDKEHLLTIYRGLLDSEVRDFGPVSALSLAVRLCQHLMRDKARGVNPNKFYAKFGYGLMGSYK